MSRVVDPGDKAGGMTHHVTVLYGAPTEQVWREVREAVRFYAWASVLLLTLTGCVMAWEVSGGRGPYQVALERLSPGRMKWHCTCADAVYRGEQDPNHVCKHVTGLLECLPLAA